MVIVACAAFTVSASSYLVPGFSDEKSKQSRSAALLPAAGGTSADAGDCAIAAAASRNAQGPNTLTIFLSSRLIGSPAGGAAAVAAGACRLGARCAEQIRGRTQICSGIT